MAKKHLTSFEPEDVLRVVLQCTKCGAEASSARECRQFKNIGLQASVSVIPAKAGNQNPVAGKYAFAANGLWIPAKAGNDGEYDDTP